MTLSVEQSVSLCHSFLLDWLLNTKNKMFLGRIFLPSHFVRYVNSQGHKNREHSSSFDGFLRLLDSTFLDHDTFSHVSSNIKKPTGG